MTRSLSSALTWRGVLAVVIGLVTISWPGITVGALLIIFAVFVLLDAIGEFGLAYLTRHEGLTPVGHGLVGLLGIAAAVVTLAWPSITALVLVVCIGVWAIVTGFIEASLAFTLDLETGERALLAVAGGISVVLGIVLLAHPDGGVFALAELFGLFSLVFGVGSLVTAYRLRHLPPGTAPYPDDEVTQSRQRREAGAG